MPAHPHLASWQRQETGSAECVRYLLPGDRSLRLTVHESTASRNIKDIDERDDPEVASLALRRSARSFRS
jgi:hypothetical protein